jgi:ribosome-binding protein aMBF1 (putative translation factor)
MESIVEVIKEGEIIRMSESQAIDEDLFVLRKVIEQEREILDLSNIESLKPAPASRLEEWRAGQINLKKNNVLADLKDNFHWEISRVRRMKNISRKQLADKVEESEESLRMIEFGELPSDDFVLISKIERVLGIDLRREKQISDVTLADLQKMDEEKVREEIDNVQHPEFLGNEIEIED